MAALTQTLFAVTEVYADPNHSSYEALRFVSGVLTTFTPKVRIDILHGQQHMFGSPAIMNEDFDGLYLDLFDFCVLL